MQLMNRERKNFTIEESISVLEDIIIMDHGLAKEKSQGNSELTTACITCKL